MIGPCCVWISPATVQMGICVRVLSAMPVTLEVKRVSERKTTSETLRPPLSSPSIREPLGLCNC
jgi:hypothetical protein